MIKKKMLLITNLENYGVWTKLDFKHEKTQLKKLWISVTLREFKILNVYKNKVFGTLNLKIERQILLRCKKELLWTF